MSFDKELAKELEEIVVHGLSELPIPYEKGNSIRVKNIVIRKHANGYRTVSYTHLRAHET